MRTISLQGPRCDRRTTRSGYSWEGWHGGAACVRPAAVRQILAVTTQQVEGDEARLAPPEQEIVKQGLPVAVQTDDLAVEDDRPLQFGAEGLRECAEGLELVSIPRDELASPVLDLGHSAETIVLDLEQPVLMGARFRVPRSWSGWNFI